MTQDLIARARAGDEAAARALYESHRGRVMRLAYALLGDGQEAEDVMQDVMVQALTRLEKYDGSRGSFRTWLGTITVSRCRDRRRWFAGRARRLREWWMAQEPPAYLDPAAAPGRVAMESDVGRALSRLTPRQREAIVLRVLGELSFEELGEALGVPLRTAQSRVNSAYATLRRELADVADVARADGMERQDG